jgi:hypothetical protein
MATPQFKTRVRAAMACRIANLDRVKFNDAVANKLYPCAPSTIGGSARLFTEEDLLPLYYFARLTEFGIPAGRAGYLACELHNATRHEGVDEADRFILLVGTMTSHIVPSVQKYPESVGKPPKNYDPLHEQAGRSEEFPNGMSFAGIGRILFTIEFYVKHAREIIAERLAYEASILGEEDGE